jgi:hypothetical protein
MRSVLNCAAIFQSIKFIRIMNLNFHRILGLALISLLTACGGGGGGSSSTFTVTRSWEGTTYSCPSKASYDVCTAGDCSQCTCTVGCSANAAKARLKVTLTPATLAVDQPGTLTLALGNSAAVNQTVSFTLNYPAGGVGYSAVSFSAPCTTPTLNVGGQSFVATVVVPANTTACTFEVQKRFTAAASPVQFTLTGLDKVELEGSLPSVTVVP